MMTETINQIQYQELSHFINCRLGLHFPSDRWNDLERSIRLAMKKFGFTKMDRFIKWLLAASLNKEQLQQFASFLTVSETYFYREPDIFQILQTQIVSEIITRRERENQKYLRIWSAGCSSGEEPYSIVILLDSILDDLNAWNLTLLGTDLNMRALEKAKKGVYGNWSFRKGMPAQLKAKYFRAIDEGKYEINPQIRKLVHFTYLNLVEDDFPSLTTNTVNLDIIFCRNVLIYFTDEKIRLVLKKLSASLVSGGWLVLSQVDASYINFSNLSALYLKPVTIDGVTLFQKSDDLPPSDNQNIPATTIIRRRAIPRQIRVIPGLSETSHDRKFPVQTSAGADQNRKHPVEADLYEDALQLFHQKKYPAVVAMLSDFMAASDLYPKDKPHLMILLARALANLGKLTEARNWCEKALTQEKLNANILYLHASILLELGDTEAAEAGLKRAIYLESEMVMAHFALGNLCLQQKRHAEADKYFNNVLFYLKKFDDEVLLSETDGLTSGDLKIIVSGMKSE